MDQLTEYLNTQLAAGYTKEQLQKYLLSQGYTQEALQAAFSQTEQKETSLSPSPQSIIQAQTSPQTTSSNKGNSDGELSSYILSSLQQGYNTQQIFDYLQSQGYAEKKLERAFSQINKQYYQGQLPQTILHKHDVGSKTVMKIGIMFLAIIIITGGGFYFLQTGMNSADDFKLLDITIENMQSHILPGEDLDVSVHLTNLGDPGLVDIQFKYFIKNAQGKIVHEEGSMRAFQSTLGFTYAVSIPSRLEDGTYSLYVYANYKNTEAHADKPFVVGAEDIPLEPIEPPSIIPEEKPVVTPESTDSNTSSPLQEQATDFNNQVTNILQDQTNLNKALAEENSYIAGDYCALVNDPLLQSQCYVHVARSTDDAQFCSSIQDTRRKDDCYLEFVLSGKPELCNKVRLPENKALCKELTQFAIITSYIESKDPKELLEYAGKTAPEMNLSNRSIAENLSTLGINDFIS